MKDLAFYHVHLITFLFGSWPTAQGTAVTSTVQSFAREFHDFLCARYNVTPPNLKKKSDGRSQSFSVRHKLSRRNGGLVSARQNEVRDELLYLARRAFPPQLRTRRTPNPPGSQQVRGGGTSGEGRIGD